MGARAALATRSYRGAEAHSVTERENQPGISSRKKQARSMQRRPRGSNHMQTQRQRLYGGVVRDLYSHERERVARHAA